MRYKMKKLIIILVLFMFCFQGFARDSHILDDFVTEFRSGNIGEILEYIVEPVELFSFQWYIDEWPDEQDHVLNKEDIEYLLTQTYLNEMRNDEIWISDDDYNGYTYEVTVNPDYGAKSGSMLPVNPELCCHPIRSDVAG